MDILLLKGHGEMVSQQSRPLGNGCWFKVVAIRVHFHAKEIVFLSKVLLEFIRKTLFIVDKRYCLHQKFIS